MLSAANVSAGGRMPVRVKMLNLETDYARSGMRADDDGQSEGEIRGIHHRAIGPRMDAVAEFRCTVFPHPNEKGPKGAKPQGKLKFGGSVDGLFAREF